MNRPVVTHVIANRSLRGLSHAFHLRSFLRQRVRPVGNLHRSFLAGLLVLAALAGFPGFLSGNAVVFAEATEAATPAPPEPAYAEQPLPRDGEVRTFNEQERIAPFEIKAAAGSHYLVKLADAASNADVMTIFVKGGSIIRVDVPLGTYELRYAAGEQWYGYERLFGPKTGYSKADTRLDFKRTGNQVSGYSVTLYAVPSGNLSTRPIDASEF